MRIGIDISQMAYEETGVANYLLNLVEHLVSLDRENDYILFYSSLRKEIKNKIEKIKNTHSENSGQANKNVKIKTFRIPPSLLDLLWNKLHILPVEWFIGKVDVFISSDWTQPPTIKAKRATILYDLLVYKFAHEMHRKIVTTQRRRLRWVQKEADIVFCISESTKKDAQKILHIPEKKLVVLYPGL